MSERSSTKHRAPEYVADELEECLLSDGWESRDQAQRLCGEAAQAIRSLCKTERVVWIVWFAYYSEQANVGIVEADNPDDACQRFWDQHGDGGDWPVSGVHALLAVPGRAAEIHAGH